MSDRVSGSNVQVVQRSLHLQRELPFLPPPRTVREIGFVTYTTGAGQKYTGELSPLPGFSRELLSEAIGEWRDVQGHLPLLEEYSFDGGGGWVSFLRDIRSPSLRCGLEGVIIDYLFSDRARYEPKLVRSHVECNALLMPGFDTPLEMQCAAALGKGFRSLKFKITPHTSSEVIACMQQVAPEATCSFRLDANRSFSIDEFQRLVPRLERLPIEYCEEPVSDRQQLPALIAQCPVPIALDETTRELDAEEWISWGAKGLVLKPSLNGGLLSLLPLIARIGASGARVTLSSSFESGVGLRAIALLASLASECGPVGLDTASFLQDDQLRPHFPVGEANLSVHELVQCRYQGDMEV